MECGFEEEIVKEVNGKMEEAVEDSDEEGRIFDYCDDSDGTNSEDENFSKFGIPSKEEDDVKVDIPIKKQSSLVFFNEGVIEDDNPNLEVTSLDLAVGQCYPTKEDLETRLKMMSVVHKFDFNVNRSTRGLLTVGCWVKGCSWGLRATTLRDFPKFHVRKYVGKHTCSITERSSRARKATPEILGQLYKDFVGGIGPSVLPMHVADALTKRFKIKIEYWKAYRTLRCARQLVNGTHESGYSELPSYLYMIRRANPGTFTRLEVDGNDRFKYLFIAFSASIKGFPFLRKVVVVDGTFLKGKYKGTLLTAASQDGNFQIFPIAFAVVDTENDESWEWFFKQLSYVIPDDSGLAIISDRHKSIGKAIKAVYPQAARGICTYHLYKNILVRYKGREAFGLVKKAANAFRPIDFEASFGQIRALNPALHSYLQKADVRLWTRVHFPGDRYNITTSNIAESLNRVLSQSRSLPIVHLLEEVRAMMTRWFSDRRNDALRLNTTLTRAVEAILERRMQNARLFQVQDIDADRVQVTSGSTLHVVNFSEGKCTCCRFELEKIPCEHAIAGAESRKMSRISLAHPYYSRGYLVSAYSTAVMPTDSAMPIPEHVAEKVCCPPDVKKRPGRPKKSRIKSALENAMLSKRPRLQHTCRICNQVGHNRATCKVKSEV